MFLNALRLLINQPYAFSWLFIQKRSGKYNHEKLSVIYYFLNVIVIKVDYAALWFNRREYLFSSICCNPDVK